MGSFGANVAHEAASDLQGVISSFGEVKANIRVPIIELKSTYGLSALRDVTTVVETGAVTNDLTEYKLATGTTTAASAKLESAERGRYIPGVEAQAGIGVRVDHAFTGTQSAEWGYFDSANGLGYGVDATGIYVFVLRGSSYTKIYQSSWNADKVDGTGSSHTTLSLAKGNIFSVNITWYGYGVIEFSVYLPDSSGRQIKVIVHRFSPSAQTSIANPNLPITASVSNGGTTANIDLYVGGRQFSIYSDYVPNRRVNAQERIAMGSVGETFLPVVSFRKKSAFRSVSVKLEGMDILVNGDMFYEVRLAPTLTEPSFGTPTGTTAAETACEVDIVASGITGGQILYKGMIKATGAGQNVGGDKAVAINFDVPGEQIVTLCIRRNASTGGTVSAVVRWAEEW